jgi:hypothetical protein
MKKETFLMPLVLVAALCLPFSLAAFAAEDASYGPGRGAHHKRMFDAKTVESVTGDVTLVNKISRGRGTSYSVHLVLKTETEEIPVHLGPSWYLDKQEVKIGQNDKIEVKGSRVTFQGGKQAIVAAEVKKGDALLKLRDENGTPAWSRRKDVREKTEQ